MRLGQQVEQEERVEVGRVRDFERNKPYLEDFVTRPAVLRFLLQESTWHSGDMGLYPTRRSRYVIAGL